MAVREDQIPAELITAIDRYDELWSRRDSYGLISSEGREATANLADALWTAGIMVVVRNGKAYVPDPFGHGFRVFERVANLDLPRA